MKNNEDWKGWDAWRSGREMIFLRSAGWNVHDCVGANSWILRFGPTYWWNDGFGIQNSWFVGDYASQKSISSWNGLSEEMFVFWVVRSTRFFSANIVMILVFGQALMNDELWRSDFWKRNLILFDVSLFFIKCNAVTMMGWWSNTKGNAEDKRSCDNKASGSATGSAKWQLFFCKGPIEDATNAKATRPHNKK